MKNKVFVIILLSGLLSRAQSLQDYIRTGEENNPKIQAFNLQYEMAAEKINESITLPNTELGAGYFVSEPETRTGAQRLRLSVRQMLPWFGTLTARENYAGTLADAQLIEVVIVKRKLGLNISKSYYQLYSYKAKQRILEENIVLLKTYEQLALTALEVGNASAVDVLKLQIRQNELQQELEVLNQDLMSESTRFNNLLGREENANISIVDTLAIPEQDSILERDNLSLNPELIRFNRLYESVAYAELLNQKSKSPNIGFGLDYVAVSERPDLDFSDNGKDILMPMVSFSIPIFNKQYRSRTVQNSLQQKAINAQKSDRFNTLETLLSEAISQRNAARIQFNIQMKNLTQAKNAEQILIRNYETGTINFNDILDIQELQLKFQLNQINNAKVYYEQSAIINYLIS